MCNLYSSTLPPDAMRKIFAIREANYHLGNTEPLDAIWPKYEAPVVRLTKDGERELLRMSWGFLTPKLSKKTGKPIAPDAWNNARADKVTTNAMWRDAFLKRRCLVPATSFCEAKGRNPARYFWFGLTGAVPRPPFAFAGLWRGIQPGLPEEQVKTLTHTIITTTANAIVKPVHPDRMPVILDPGDYEQWLTGSDEDAQALLKPFPAEQMRIVAEGEGLRSDAGGAV